MPSGAEHSGGDDSVVDPNRPLVPLAKDLLNKANEIYPKRIARKHHFVESYLAKLKGDTAMAALYAKPKRKNSLVDLLSENFDDLRLGESKGESASN